MQPSDEPSGSNNIENFELLLKKNKSTKSLIYNSPAPNKPTIKPQDVLDNVYSQIKLIQTAEGKSSKKLCQVNKVYKSNFLSVSKLPVYNEIPNVASNFETQCFSNTQLINIIEDVESIDNHKGMTQEFDSTFAHSVKDDINTLNKDDRNNPGSFTDSKTDRDNTQQLETKEFETTFTQTNVDKTVTVLNDAIERDVNNSCDDHTELNNDKEPDGEVITLQNKTVMEICEVSHNMPVAINKLPSKPSIAKKEVVASKLEVQDNDDKDLTNTETVKVMDATNSIDQNSSMKIDNMNEVRSPSPVLEMKTKKVFKAPPNLVVSLDAFEKFERIAIPLIEASKDLDTCKYLINSQILGKELCLNTDEDVMINHYDPLSPIIEKSFEIHLKEIEKARTDNIAYLDNIKDSSDKHSDGLKDEILFSSDEENDFMYKEFKDLPLTAALETSFYDHSDVLDKTMYVIFQTASNKSIQICSNSFKNAQLMLDEDDNMNGTNFSLNELVEICDEKNFSNLSSADLKAQEENNTKVKIDGEIMPVNDDNNIVTQTKLKERDKEINEDTKMPDLTNNYDMDKMPSKKDFFVGFKTASNKNIDISEKALDVGKKVFMNIEIDEKNDINQEENNLEPTITEGVITKDNIKTNAEKNELENEIGVNINDELIVQEFENIEMSLEERDDEAQSNAIGFKTASDKAIKLSDASKAKFKEVFKDIDLDVIYGNTESSDRNDSETAEKEPKLFENATVKRECPPEIFIGFKTANNKDIKVSDQALANTKSIFQDIDTEMVKPIQDTNLEKYTIQKDFNQSSTSKEFGGFKTANNKTIRISELALVKSSKIFKDIDSGNEDYFDKVEKPDKIFKGFKTATNKNVNVSENSLLKSKKMFEEIDEKDYGKSIDDLNIKIKDNASFCGFKNANNKSVTVSEDSIAKSKKLFEDLVTENTRDKQPCDKEPKNQDYEFKGFQTASKKPVMVSAHALEKSKKLFQDIDNITPVKINTSAENKIKENKYESKDLVTKKSTEIIEKVVEDLEIDRPRTFVGFKTASNKRVNVSKDAVEKSKTIFSDLDNLTENGSLLENPIGFYTASNKKVRISKEALEKTKNIFNDVEIPDNNECGISSGFQTANNKKVAISEEALKKTKDLFNDIEFPDVKAQDTFKGFQTASNKKVAISKEAIEKTKALFNDIEIPQNTELNNFLGFQTANNEKVAISIEAIEKSKTLFNDIEICEKPDLGKFSGFLTASKKKVIVSEQALAKSRQVLQDLDAYNEVYKNEESKKVTGNIVDHTKSVFSFKTANNKDTTVSEAALKNSRKLLEDTKVTENKTLDKTYSINKTRLQKTLQDANLDNINTQILDNFKDSLCTEDFEMTQRNKRSGSPILSCPRAKKRKKFETPYKDDNNKQTATIIKPVEKPTECTKNIKFSENYKKNKIYSLKDLTKLGDTNKKYIDPYISQFNLDNILNFEFAPQRNDVTNTKMSIDELKNIFLSVVNKNLVPDGWIDNHLKLILWKLLSYEASYPNLSLLCTVQNVIDQLKYRYDKELYNAERPVLRKILERDDVSTKTMVLCVAGVYVDGVSMQSVTNTDSIELLLTDGWYFIKATIDGMLSKLVCTGRIFVGCKIVTNGAELVNCDQGIAPWEDTSAVRLKMFGNSTRPAPWDARLGYTRAAILTQLSSVKVDGGKVGRMRVFVTRVYPLLYVEKFEDGSTVTRSERLEHLHEMKCETERELVMERIYEDVQREFTEQESQDSEILDSGKRKICDSGSQLAKMMKRSADPMEFRAQLTTSQVKLLQDHTSRYRDRMLEAIQARAQGVGARNVVPLARGRVVAMEGGREARGVLSIWKPNEAILELFREGAWIELMNVMPTAIRYSEIQITAGRQSLFRQAKCEKPIPPPLMSLQRKCYKISDVAENPAMATDYHEIDTVGIVFLIEPSHREFESNRNFQNVYLADADKNIICVNFWGGVKKFGFENILDTGQIVACANLQKRAGNTRKSIPQFRVTEFTYFTKTPKNFQAREMVYDIDKKLYGLDRRKFCDDCIAIKSNYTAIRCLNNNENDSPYRFNKSDYSFARNKMFIDTPLGVKTGKNEDANLSLTGLDFESTFKLDTQELSPKTLQRKKKVNEKIAKLKMYGEPPPLSSINIINKSINAKNSYKCPLIASSAATINLPLNVATVNQLPEESPKTIPKSPVISTKRAYGKSVPVKLNFADERRTDLIDHFAEEFDGSPPLSLE